MDISSYHRTIRRHADLLRIELTRRLPAGLDPTGQQVAPLLSVLGMSLKVVEKPPDGCSVAGSCDHQTQSITVVSASRGRMQFTALHELGHLLGGDLDDFQDAVYRHAGVTGGQVEEDACDAFASMMLLPDELLDSAFDIHGLSARGLADLIDTGQASIEACAVAVAQRLTSPGYVLIIDSDGTTRFAARSGDVLPIGRGADQSRGDLRTVLRGGVALRTRGSLAFAGGSGTHELYIDAVARDGLILVVACESTPDWQQLQTPAEQVAAPRGIEAYCADCDVEFTAWRLCSNCGDPRHETCGRCSCEQGALQGERMCLTCFLVQPPAAFAGSATSCRACTD